MKNKPWLFVVSTRGVLAAFLLLLTDGTLRADLQLLEATQAWGNGLRSVVIGNSGHVFINHYERGDHYDFWNGTEIKHGIPGPGWWTEAYMDNNDCVAVLLRGSTYRSWLLDMHGNVRSLHRADASWELDLAMNNSGTYVSLDQINGSLGEKRAWRGNFAGGIPSEKLIAQTQPEVDHGIDINDAGQTGVICPNSLGYMATAIFVSDPDGSNGHAEEAGGGEVGDGKFKLLNSGRFVYTGSKRVGHEGHLMLGANTVVAAGVSGGWEASRSGNIVYYTGYYNGNVLCTYVHGVTTQIWSGGGIIQSFSINDGGQVAFTVRYLSEPERYEAYLYTPGGAAGSKLVYNGKFAGSNLAGWDTSGTAEVVAAPGEQWGAASVASLTTTVDAPQTVISQPINVPNWPYDLSFDYEFTATAGTLKIMLGTTEVGSVAAPENLAGAPAHFSTTVSDPSLLGVPGLVLSMMLEGADGSGVLVNNIDVTPANLPGMVVEQTPDVVVTNNASFDFGPVLSGETNSAYTFTIFNRNTSGVPLTNLAVEKIGPNFSDFTVSDLAVTSLADGESTSFTVSFAPQNGGNLQGQIVLTGNDPNHSPLRINVTGYGLSTSVDADSDGLNDAAEYRMSALGFDYKTAQRELVNTLSSNANAAFLYSQAQYDDNRVAGRADVTGSPAVYGLFTQTEFDNNRAAGRADVTGNPAAYNLYTADSIMDLNLDKLMIKRDGDSAVVSLQFQTSTNLATDPFDDYGDPITNSIPMPGNKGFIRVRAQPTPAPVQQ